MPEAPQGGVQPGRLGRGEVEAQCSDVISEKFVQNDIFLIMRYI